ncbi:MAG: hypothetical protein IJM37_07480 [Lachnospiraceae bacterium]|nr:hypothetical protein [Lachnospiraceae bacterium]
MMARLCLIRDKIKKIYTKYEKFIQPALKLIVGILVMYLLTVNLNYMSALNKWWIIVAIAVICAMLPWSWIAVLINGYILVNFSAVSWEVVAVMAGLYLIMLCTYYIFHPQNSILLVIVPVFLWFRLPLVPVVVTALLVGPSSIFTLIFGTVIYYVVMIVKDNAATFASKENTDLLQKLSFIVTKIFGNREMWLMCAVMALTLLVIYIVKRRRFNYSREIAVLLGVAAGVVVYLSGAVMLNIPIDAVRVVIGSIVALIIGLIVSFGNIALDYSRVEYVQFEDDDYYYYVKAVPKFAITEPEFTVKKFRHKEEPSGEPEQKGQESEDKEATL